VKKTIRDKILIGFLLFLFSGLIRLWTEDQAWVNNSLAFKVDSKFSLTIIQETRCNEITYLDPFLINIRVMLNYKLPKNFHLAGYYRRQDAEKKDVIIHENRYIFESGWKINVIKDTAFDIRIQGEIRRYVETPESNCFRMRMRFRIKTKISVGSLVINPFVATEPFWVVEEDGIERNRCYLGAEFPMTKNVNFVLNYIREDRKNTETIHVLNSGFKLNF